MSRDINESRPSYGDAPRESGDVGEGPDFLARYAEARPHSVAVRDQRTALSWQSLEAEVSALSSELRADGVGAGSPVLLLVDSCVETIVAYWAVRSLGGIAVLADPGCKRHEFEQFVSATQPGWVFSTRPGTWERLGLNELAASSPLPGMRWYLQEQSDRVEQRVRGWEGRTLPGRARSHPFAELPEAAVVLFSSGTTGHPKTIVHTDRSVTALAHVQRDVWQLTEGDVVLGALPFHTIYGAIYTAASVVYNGACLALLERFKPEIALRRIEEWGITTAALVPAMVQMMLKLDDNDRYDLSSLRVTYTGSAPISDEDIARFAELSGAPLLATYGLSECPGAALEPSNSQHVAGAAGKMCPGFEAVARGADGRPLPAGEVGEITLRGPSMMHSYLGDPELTDQRIRDGWVYTQDLGSIDEHGYVSVSGRAGDMIIRGGLNIAPKEVEGVLLGHPAVLGAVVVGVDDEIYGQVVKAYVVPGDGVDVARLADVLRDHCAAALNRAKVPEQIVLLRELPMNAGGKVIRRALAETELRARIRTEEPLQPYEIR